MEIHTTSHPAPPAITSKDIILASNSPRRRELLGMIVPEFAIALSRDIDETFDTSLAAHRVPEHLSRIKSEAYADLATGNNLVITADTVVICEGTILGKPHDAAEARAMLELLSGRAHHVVTGVTMRTEKGVHSFSETTNVHFGRLTGRDITEYIERYRPFDKAGAYGIQEWIGAIGIEAIEGCYYNVMGLPLYSLRRLLRALY